MQKVQDPIKRYEGLLTLLLGRKKLSGKTWDDVADETGISKRCLMERVHCPERYRLGELFTVAKALGIEAADVWESMVQSCRN